ncbi:hypothetical protein LCGC14_2395730 [marine sediment metagenome]|uniref:Uncharacterized protein n=1 Tax=marine sediment metagenome TaxID=412755 RepID=A0A0F9ER97_9ZZZZ
MCPLAQSAVSAGDSTRRSREPIAVLARTMVRPVAVVAAMKIPRCTDHWRLRYNVVPGCHGCRAEQRALVAIAQKRDRAPKTLARKSRAFHAAGGGTEQFDLAKYERLMEALK